MGWIRCVRCEKLQHDFVTQTFVLIEPVQYVLQQVSCSYGTFPNAPKYYETHQNISLGSNGVDWSIRCEKSRCDFVARTFALVAPIHPVLHRVSCSYKMITNAPKHYYNAPKHEFRVPMQWIGCVRCKKSWCDNVARAFVLMTPVHPVLHRVSCCYETIPNAPKHYEKGTKT